MNTLDVAKLLRVDQGTVERWIRRGLLEAFVVPHNILSDEWQYEITTYHLSKGLGGVHIDSLRELKTVEEVSFWLRVSGTTIRKYIRTRRLNAISLPAKTLYRIPAAWVEECFGLPMSVPLASMAEASRFLEVSQRGGMLQKWIRNGSLQGIHIGDTYAITRSSLAAWKLQWVRSHSSSRKLTKISVRGTEFFLWDSDLRIVLYLAEHKDQWVWRSFLTSLGLSNQLVTESVFRLRQQFHETGFLEEVNRLTEFSHTKRLFLRLTFGLDEISF